MKFWRDWLRARYGGDIGALNRNRLTGYRDFEEVPAADNVPYPLHRKSS